jgi:hypothetical protein
MNDISDTFVIVLTAILFLSVVYLVFSSNSTKCNISDDMKEENFGALQSLYSNDGIQDAYLTLENDPDNPYYQDPYAYWRNVTWDLPTRNLHRVVFYPYLYEYNVDRYGVVWPYWSP